MSFDTTSNVPEQHVQQSEASASENPYPQVHPPYHITCLGRIELPEEDPSFGTYWKRSRLRLGNYPSVKDAITAAERLAPNLQVTEVPGTLSFHPLGVVIRDSSTRLVLTGWCDSTIDPHIVWSDPVLDDDAPDFQAVATQLEKLAASASGWEMSSIAALFRRNAERLRAHLVDRLYRERAAYELEGRRHVVTARDTFDATWKPTLLALGRS